MKRQAIPLPVIPLPKFGMDDGLALMACPDRPTPLSRLLSWKLYEADQQTEAILMMGEIGSSADEEAAAFTKQHVTKPVAAFIAGRTAPPGKRMGYAGAIISGGKGTAAEKIAALRDVGIDVADSLADMGEAVKRAMGKPGR